MNRESKIIAIVLMVLVSLLVAGLRFYTKRKLRASFESGNFEEYQSFLDSSLVKIYIRPYQRELSRLTGYLAAMDNEGTDRQIRYMLEDINTTSKQKAEIASRGFYHYLSVEDFKRAGDMFKAIEENKQEVPDYSTISLMNDIFVLKKADHIDTLKKNIEVLKKQEDEDGHIKQNIGIFEYLIAIQYQNKKQFTEMRKYLESSLEKCKGTPYEGRIRRLL